MDGVMAAATMAFNVAWVYRRRPHMMWCKSGHTVYNLAIIMLAMAIMVMIKMAMVIIYNASMLYIGPLAYAKKDQSLNLKLGTLEGLQGILSISHSVSNTPLIILQTLLIFNLTLKRSNHIKLMGDHMANETGSFCLPNARMCVSLSPR